MCDISVACFTIRCLINRVHADAGKSWKINEMVATCLTRVHENPILNGTGKSWKTTFSVLSAHGIKSFAAGSAIG